MKTPKILLLLFIFALNSCSSDSETPEDPTLPTSKFAMTAKVDGTLWEMNNPFNTNYATKPLFDYYPTALYIQLAGRKNVVDEIRLYIKRSDLKVGTYSITPTTFDATKTQIEVSLNSKAKLQYVAEGTLSITSVDLTAKTVAGTFSFNCVEDYSKTISTSNPVTTKVTEGTFNYKYDVAN
ncbi:hypothetical protein [Flavobacterium reichenbachii]|uniref:DUF4843 domain-containing protein n=1 Tax=Flavobacterium reichenbachii TaxID=362418 RepID=A0A085ZKP3_9FLAO|nr:hypothetical protein [Flavobacterium reichenbachii]KFF05007.1 hypothetical protein IW19_05450 [Flavobacterium reichenbachii]OXB16319.1 hypothetical protein B0A68_08680 [Flavobacterium reichenbachii]